MVSIASDHGGYRLKEHIKAYLTAKGISVLDCGCDSLDSCDYPIFGKAAAQAVADGRCEKGIVICTTGIGISICANKVKGIRCGLCSDPLSAELTRKHNNDGHRKRVKEKILATSVARIFLCWGNCNRWSVRTSRR